MSQLIENDAHVVPAAPPYRIALAQVPRAGSVVVAGFLGAVTFTPSAGYYRVHAAPPQVEFHASAAGQAVLVTYEGMGAYVAPEPPVDDAAIAAAARAAKMRVRALSTGALQAIGGHIVEPGVHPNRVLRITPAGDLITYCGGARPECTTYVLLRTTAGLLFRDSFTRADGALGAGWEDRAGGRIGVVGQRAQNTVALVARDRVYPAAAVLVPFCVVQATVRTPFGVSYAGVLAARYNPTLGRALAISPPEAGTGSGNLVAWRIGGSSTGNDLSLASPTSLYSIPRTGTYACKMYDADTTRRCWVNGALVFTESTVDVGGATGDYSRVGLSGTVAIGWNETASGNGYANYDDVCAYRGNSITVTELPGGWSARAGGITAAESGGTATIQLGGTMCPLASVELLDAVGGLVATLSPADGVWGGDSYAATLTDVAVDPGWPFAALTQKGLRVASFTPGHAFAS